MKTVYNAVQLPLFVASKICSVCNLEKPLEQFQRDSSKKDGYRRECKVCINAKRKQRYNENPEKHRARSRANRAANPEYTRNYNRQYRPKKNARERERYATEPEFRAMKNAKSTAFNAQRPDLLMARNKRYRVAHRPKFTQYTMSRYARIKAVTVEDVDYQKILDEFDGICYICEKAVLPHHKTEFDHVIPITRGGIHAESNIRVTHARCNSRKNAKLLEEMTPFQRRGPDA